LLHNDLKEENIAVFYDDNLDEKEKETDKNKYPLLKLTNFGLVEKESITLENIHKYGTTAYFVCK
jgi:serine/threonine protein kinase